jgi:WD40 repeat protein
VRRWDADAGKEVGDPLPGVNGVDFSADGRILAVGSPADDENVRLYDAGNGTLIRTLRGGTTKTTRVAFSPRGDKLAAGSGLPSPCQDLPQP